MVATAIYSVKMVLWKPHFLFAEPLKSVGTGMLSPECLL